MWKVRFKDQIICLDYTIPHLGSRGLLNKNYMFTEQLQVQYYMNSSYAVKIKYRNTRQHIVCNITTHQTTGLKLVMQFIIQLKVSLSEDGTLGHHLGNAVAGNLWLTI